MTCTTKKYKKNITVMVYIVLHAITFLCPIKDQIMLLLVFFFTSKDFFVNIFEFYSIIYQFMYSYSYLH